jgi:hypothetical protein
MPHGYAADQEISNCYRTRMFITVILKSFCCTYFWTVSVKQTECYICSCVRRYMVNRLVWSRDRMHCIKIVSVSITTHVCEIQINIIIASYTTPCDCVPGWFSKHFLCTKCVLVVLNLRVPLPQCFFFFLVSWGGVRQSTWHVGLCLAYCTSPEW